MHSRVRTVLRRSCAAATPVGPRTGNCREVGVGNAGPVAQNGLAHLGRGPRLGHDPGGAALPGAAALPLAFHRKFRSSAAISSSVTRSRSGYPISLGGQSPARQLLAGAGGHISAAGLVQVIFPLCYRCIGLLRSVCTEFFSFSSGLSCCGELLLQLGQLLFQLPQAALARAWVSFFRLSYSICTG